MPASIQRDRLLDRFLRYVQIDTTADEGSGSYPSSPGQLTLGKMLADELRAAGLQDVEQTAQGIVLATLPANVPHATPVVAWCAHLDTSPETTGRGVRPQVIRDYQGVDLTLPAALPDGSQRVIRAEDNPELASLHGCTLITTDGSTLLGADDKAGVAAIMEAVQHLAEHPELPHGTIKVCLTCDEEVGHGVDHIDLVQLAADVCYTLDGSGAGQIDVETFSADLAIVTVTGVNIHPSIGKGRMVNAVRAAAAFIDRLPRDRCAPETTDGREGFVHPYHIEGGVAEVTLRILLRDFETAALADYAQLLRQTATDVMREVPRSRIDVTIRPQYRNMRDGLAEEPRAVALAQEAYRRIGVSPQTTIVRGGTDGSRLTELGLPTPNLSTGEHNPHSPLEWTCLEELATAVQHLIALAELWGNEGRD